MFSTIFKQELKYWFNKPVFYIYAVIFLILSFLISATTAGIFDGI
ncbi:MAG: ABC-2 type transport system permease protein, partial [Polaribacter sp.]